MATVNIILPDTSGMPLNFANIVAMLPFGIGAAFTIR
jgi:hypothetical protein